MRGFVMILCFTTLAFARPDVSELFQQGATPSGYQYQQGANSAQSTSPVGNAVYQQNTATQINDNLQTRGPTNYVDEPESEEPLVSKQFYIHTAPEDTSTVNKVKHFKLGRAQKNYRVIFIKAPSSSTANAQITAEYAPREEKTVIYVLSQKEHEVNINDIATPAPTQPSKPEVFFIKYKTPEEAAHAQQQIQAQYDSLGGVSQVSDEGLIPVSSVEGALDNDEDFAKRQPAAGFASTPSRY